MFYDVFYGVFYGVYMHCVSPKHEETIPVVLIVKTLWAPGLLNVFLWCESGAADTGMRTGAG